MLPPHPHQAAYRVLDANFNRASEGLRVLEDFARFVLEDAFLSRQCKTMRHALAGHRQAVGEAKLILERDTLGDLGTTIQLDTEYDRSELDQVVQASQKRVEQSLRCLEEYTKLVAPEQAAPLEQLRYTAYTLFRALSQTAANQQQLADAHVYLLIPGGDSDLALERFATPLVDAGVDCLQLRDKQLDDRELLNRARVLRRLTRPTTTRLIINDRPDIALLSQADGVHVGQEEIPARDVRRLVGNDLLLGVSTHNIEQARQAVLDGANYIGCGPTFPSTTKAFTSFAGIEFLQQVASEIGLPAFAIGGITAHNLPQVLATGIRRVAVGAAITADDDPVARLREFNAAISSA